MTIYITSDSHFHHKNVLDFEDRPFNNVEEMNEGMIRTWNDSVKKTDTVYHLGDFSFGTVHEWRAVLNELRGNIILIKGNHDKTKIVNTLVREGWINEYHPLGTILTQEKMTIHLCHYPVMIGCRPRLFNLHGHLHSYDTEALNHLNIGVDSTFAKTLDAPFGAPIPLDIVVEYLKTLNPMIEQEFEEMKRKEGR